jgi:adenosylhomocysteine nucleosidase
MALGKLVPAYRAVISFGIAGGLDPALAPGDTVLATGVIAANERWAAHLGMVRNWAQCLSANGQRIILAEIAGVEAPVHTSAAKAALRSATAAAAVDMESHIAAAFAAMHGIPFAALRVICDPADRSLPSLVEVALGPDGSMTLPALLRHILRRPMQLAALPRLAWDASAAFSSLGRCRTVLGTDLGLDGPASKPFGDVP